MTGVLDKKDDRPQENFGRLPGQLAVRIGLRSYKGMRYCDGF